MNGNKVFKTLEEQIDILRSKGLTIPDEEKAKDVLLRENYFFISGYRHLFMKIYNDGVFLQGTTFDELYATFIFDRQVRNIYFKHILVIENNIKSLISYILSRKYGFREKDYLNADNFNQNPMKARQVHDVLDKMRRQIRVNGKKHAATVHYLSNYGYIPLWILVKVLSFGIVSELFTILKDEDQEEIANIYKIDVSSLAIYLSILANYRNLCAHEDILYDYRTQRTIPNTKYHYQLDIEKVDDDYKYGKNDLFAVIIIFRQMLSPEEFRNLVNEIGYEIDILDGRIDTLSIDELLNKISFPSNWRDIININ
jgi:Abortive infection bacteriophage resistance protein